MSVYSSRAEMDSEDMEVESSSDVGHSGMEEPSESGMAMESSEAMSADSSDTATLPTLAPESDCHVGQSSEGLLVGNIVSLIENILLVRSFGNLHEGFLCSKHVFLMLTDLLLS